MPAPGRSGGKGTPSAVKGDAFPRATPCHSASACPTGGGSQAAPGAPPLPPQPGPTLLLPSPRPSHRLPHARRGSAVSLAPAGAKGQWPPSRLSECSSGSSGTTSSGSSTLGSVSSAARPAGGGGRGHAARSAPPDVCLRAVRALLVSQSASTFLLVLSVFVLFGDDIRLSFFEKEADPHFDVATVVCLVLFTSEIVLASIAKRGYSLSFFFWLDVIATASLVLDLTAVSEYIMGLSGSEPGFVSQSDLSRAGRSSRVGTRVARVIRVFRLIRVIRVFKFWMLLHKTSERAISYRPSKAYPGGGERSHDDSEDEEELGSESRVGKKLSERTTVTIIVLVLAMLVVVPLLHQDDETQMIASSPEYGADAVDQAWHFYQQEKQRAWPLDETGEQGELAVLRFEWELQVLQYVFYHTGRGSCPDSEAAGAACAGDFLQNGLCFIGYAGEPGDAAAGGAEDYRISEPGPGAPEWEAFFRPPGTSGSTPAYAVAELPADTKRRLSLPWTARCGRSGAELSGVSLVDAAACPWRRLRPQEFDWYVSSPGERQHFIFFFDIREYSRFEAKMNMLMTLAIIVVLTVASVVISRGIDRLVLYPIERMIAKVQIIRQDPLYAIKLSEQRMLQRGEQGTRPRRGSILDFSQAAVGDSGATGAARGWLSLARSRRPLAAAAAARAAPAGGQRKVTLETKMLENMIVKLGSLLAIGFGEAGSDIIGRNLSDRKEGVDPMVPGRKVEAIYGLCKIQDFTILTEVLQTKTMVFVNQVAKTVHRIVDEFHGAANKNFGEAFLLVWRIDDLGDPARRARMADLSVMSFVQVVTAVSLDSRLRSYRKHPQLVASLGGSGKVSLAFGLHVGWSIEGAMGSSFKVDASYLSSNVNMAANLEAAAKHYAVTVMVSEALVRMCHPSFARLFRPIDRVRFHGSKEPIRLFVLDLAVNSLPKQSESSPFSRRDRPLVAEEKKRAAEAREAKMAENYQAHEAFVSDRFARLMRAAYTQEFFQAFERGYLNYEAGEWGVASEVFTQTRGMLSCRDAFGNPAGDGPSRVLLEHMRRFASQAPAGWAGWRDLSPGAPTEPPPRAPAGGGHIPL